MHEGVDLLATLYPLCFFRAHELRRPLKIGTREDIIAQHPELQPGVIESALQIYTRCVPYWSTLKVGAARIDLEGNVAGEVTLEDQQAAKLKIAKAERRAKAREKTSHDPRRCHLDRPARRHRPGAHHAACLADAQCEIARDWRAAYKVDQRQWLRER
jgi:ProP effector